MSQKTLSARFLVPSSEKKKAGGTRTTDFEEAQGNRAHNRFPSLAAPRRAAVGAFLESINGSGHAALVLGLEGAALTEATRRNLRFYKNPLMPALAREDGSLFRRLAADTLPVEARQRLEHDLLIVCPLLGVLAAGDLVPDYRCPIGAQLPDFGSLHAHWKPHVSATLNRQCRSRRVFSFLSGRLGALWTRAGGVGEVVSIRFVRRRGTRVFPENAAAGGLAGELLRHMLVQGGSEMAALRGFVSASGHAFAPDLSTHDGGVVTSVFAR